MRNPEPNRHTHTSYIIGNSELRISIHITAQFLLAFCPQKETILKATGLRADAHYVGSACKSCMPSILPRRAAGRGANLLFSKPSLPCCALLRGCRGWVDACVMWCSLFPLPIYCSMGCAANLRGKKIRQQLCANFGKSPSPTTAASPSPSPTTERRSPRAGLCPSPHQSGEQQIPSSLNFCFCGACATTM